MKTPPFEPVRLLDLRGQGEVAHLIRQAMGGPEIPVPPLKGRIRQTLRRKSASRRRHLRALLVGAAIFVSGGVVGAVVQPILRLREQPQMQAVESGAPVSPGRRPRAGRLPARLPSVAPPGAPLPEGTVETPALPGGPTLEESPQTHESASPPTSVLPVAPHAPEPAPIQPAQPAPVKVLRPVGVPERPAQLWANVNLRTPQPQKTQPRAGDSQKTAMREQAPNAASVLLEPAPLSPPVVPAPSMAEEPSRALRRISPMTVAAPSTAASPPAPSAVQPPLAPPASEQALLASAIRGLRVQRSPATALAALDQYQARYPKGSMLAEAARLRAEALLLLGQRGAALDELSRSSGTGAAIDEESRLVRGELAASAGRWPEALQDFDALVTAWTRGPHGEAMSPKLRARLERALWGRACARSQVGNEAGARADLQELLLRFPHGRFATQAAQRLGEPR